MVNTIDQSQRRQLLADAVWALMLRDGLSAASVRNVAKEAGLSTGSVRHFFASQSDLQVFAMQALVDRVRNRIAALPAIGTPRERLRAVLAELVPLSDTAEAEFAVWLHFVVRARADPRLAEVARTTFDEVRAAITDQVADLHRRGLTAPDLDTAAAAVDLNVLLDGLTFDALVAPHLVSRALANAVLDRAVDRLMHPGGRA